MKITKHVIKAIATPFLILLGLVAAVTLAAWLLTSSSAGAEERDNSHWWKKQGWNTNFAKTSVDFFEIKSGGPPKDGIPSIDDPQFTPLETAIKSELYQPTEPVIGLTINADARAYPLSVLTWHEIVNDEVGGVPVAVTYCPLCNAAIVFKREVNGEAVEFGTTGKLRNSDLIMYDRKTESWWQQFSGEAIVGDALGKKLEVIPARLESFEKFAARAPEGKVLVPNEPTFRNYGKNPYVNYDSSAFPFLFDGSFPKNIPPMERVVIVRLKQSAPYIASMQYIRQNGPIKTDNFTMSWEKGQNSALDSSDIANGRDVGNIIVQNADSEDLAYDVTFAFVAHAFHPEIKIIR